MSLILLGWALFGGTHLLGSTLPVRSCLIRRLGLPVFKGLYSLVALATLCTLSFAYFLNKHAGPALFVPSPGMRLATQVLMFFAVLTLGQTLAGWNPMGTLAEMKGRYPDRPVGIHRVTRHPMNLSFALFGAAHCLSNPHAGDWIFFGGFVVYAVVGALHQDRRTFAAGPEEIRRFQARTSFIPFGAMLAGKQRLERGDISKLALAVSVLAFAALRLAHPVLFGGFGR